MNITSTVFFGIATLIHIFIFFLESILWGSPKANKVFSVSEESAKEQKLFAFNQGFYNLFLAVQMILGIVIIFSFKNYAFGIALCLTSALWMLCASLVLLYSAPHLKRAVIIQGFAPALGLLAFYL